MDMEAALSQLPPDLRALVEGLPTEAARQVLAKLVAQTEITYRELTADDVEVIQVRGIGAADQANTSSRHVCVAAAHS